MTRPPQVTIAIPTFNRLSYLRQALDSALSQTYSNVQIVVSDNCSADGTADFVSSISDQRLVFLKQEHNLGMAGNWNACLERATGEFFLLLSDDDYLEASAIEKLALAFTSSEHPEQVAVACCRIWEVNQQGEKISITPAPLPCEEARDFALQFFLRKRVLHPCSALFRTNDLRQIGGYSQGNVQVAVDAMAWSRILLQRGMIAGVAEPLTNYRVHQANVTSTQRIQVWQKDIRALAQLWSEAFHGSPAELRQRLHKTARQYEGWVVAAIINQSAHSWAGRFRAIANYHRCRDTFAGLAGKADLLAGIAKLLAPEIIKRPLRKVLLSQQTVIPPALTPSK